VCVAGVRTDQLGQSEWVRLFPVPFRDLPEQQQFRKWDTVRLRVADHRQDTRPESRRPELDTMKITGHLDTKKNWAARRSVVDLLPRYSMCELRARQAENGTSLGFVVPGEVIDLTVERRDATDTTTARKFLETQGSLFAEKELVEVVPFTFRYKFRCDETECKGHEMSNIDWELAQAWRRWRHDYGEAGAVEQIRSKWIGELCASDRDTVFICGNMHQHPGSFLVLGVWWPKRVSP
jgi:hypothetical protein